jgi:hypothetical protein
MSQTKSQLIEGSAASELTAAKTLLGAGSAGAPSLTATGDTNTGIFFPTADTIAFAEGGVETVRIDSSGRVGIGTSAPSNLLTLNAPNANALTLFVGSNTGEYSSIRGKYGAGNDFAQSEIRFINADNPNGRGALAFAVGTNSTTEHMRITYDGKVGIGTTSPDAELDVNGRIYLAEGNELAWHNGAGAQAARIYGSSTDELRFDIGSTASRALTIDSSGRLLVGTSTARAGYAGGNNFTPYFQIEGNSDGTRYYSFTNNSNAIAPSAPVLNLTRSRSSSIGGTTLVQSGDWLGALSFNGYDGTNPIEAATIKAEVDGTPGVNDMPGRLVFSTTVDGASSPTSRMRISAYGRVDTFDSSGVCIQATSSRAAGTSDYIFIGRYAGTQLDSGVACYVIYTNGSFQQLSDVNLKKNIETTRDGYLEDLNKLRVVKYNWKDQQEGTTKELGLIAQEVEEVFPGLVAEMDAESEYANKGIKTSVLPYMIIKALQEATERIKQLETEMAAVKAQIS